MNFAGVGVRCQVISEKSRILRVRPVPGGFQQRLRVGRRRDRGGRPEGARAGAGSLPRFRSRRAGFLVADPGGGEAVRAPKARERWQS